MTTSQVPSRTLSLNITRDYISSWTDERAVAEFIANAFDADGENCIIDSPDGGISLDIITKSAAPTIQQLVSFGASTKRDDGTTIGMFGEGAKCAFLVLTRNHGPDSVTVKIPGFTATFCFRPPFPDFEPTLHMLLWDAPENPPGCHIRVTGIDIEACLTGRFIMPPDNLNAILIPKSTPSILSIFFRGIYCSEQQHYTSMYNWNVQRAKISRDRNIINVSDLYSEVVDALADRLDPQDPSPSASKTADADALAFATHVLARSSVGGHHSLIESGAIACIRSGSSYRCVRAICSHLPVILDTKKLCYFTNPRAAAGAREEGYTVLTVNDIDALFYPCLAWRDPVTGKPFLPSDATIAPSASPTLSKPIAATPTQLITLTRYTALISATVPLGKVPPFRLYDPSVLNGQSASLFLTSTPPHIGIAADNISSSTNARMFRRLLRLCYHAWNASDTISLEDTYADLLYHLAADGLDSAKPSA